MQAEERLGLVAQEKDFLLVDELGYGALDHALLNHNLELEIWFCSHGARFHQSGQLEVLSECVKTLDYVALERRLRAGADVSVPWLQKLRQLRCCRCYDEPTSVHRFIGSDGLRLLT